MSARRIVAIAATGALALGAPGAAIAAVSKDDPKKTEDAVLADAAKRLSVSPDKLRDALKAAQDAQLDKQLEQAVKDGDLTRKQADEIKQRREQSGTVLGPVGPRRGRFGAGPGGPGRFPHVRGPDGPRFRLFGDIAKALGVSEHENLDRWPRHRFGDRRRATPGPRGARPGSFAPEPATPPEGLIS